MGARHPGQPPDVRKLVIEHLRQRLGVPAVAYRPDDGTRTYVLVLDTGGPGRRDRVLQEAQVTVSSYAPTPGMAQELAARVDEAVHGMPQARAGVAAITGGGHPSEDPDPEVPDSGCYTATYRMVAKRG